MLYLTVCEWGPNWNHLVLYVEAAEKTDNSSNRIFASDSDAAEVGILCHLEGDEDLVCLQACRDYPWDVSQARGISTILWTHGYIWSPCTGPANPVENMSYLVQNHLGMLRKVTFCNVISHLKVLYSSALTEVQLETSSKSTQSHDKWNPITWGFRWWYSNLNFCCVC